MDPRFSRLGFDNQPRYVDLLAGYKYNPAGSKSLVSDPLNLPLLAFLLQNEVLFVDRRCPPVRNCLRPGRTDLNF